MAVLLAGSRSGAWAMATLDPPAAVGVRWCPMACAGFAWEVLNATSTRGLARRATLALCDAGFDVVRFRE